MFRKRLMMFHLALIFIVVLFIGCQKKSEEEKPKFKFLKSGKMYVEVAEVKRENISSYLEYSGKLKAEKSANIGSNLSLRIDDIVVEQGDIIRKGDLLAIMDSTQLNQAKAQFENAKEDFERMKKLKKSGSIDEQTFDKIKTLYETTKSSYKFALANTKITAPFDGIVSLKIKNEGENFSQMMPGSSGLTGILRIVNLDVLKATIDVSDQDINKIKLGQKAIVSVDNLPEMEFIGNVTFISPEADAMSGTFPCEIEIDNQNHILKPGQFTRVNIIIKNRKNVLTVPQKAIVDFNFVFIAKDDKAIRKEIEIGIQNENKAEILSGIEVGNFVIVSGNIGLKNGSKVVIRN
ncbi:MAG: efflux RND transporter periplasmic adaptor subunit [Candidatus Cloacimonetes bacterium]|nr:efflux RND transporter periplasmic adaptor subunit [Candidatus Cloacimonadota bacterium]